jgi:hypothetical protein
MGIGCLRPSDTTESPYRSGLDVRGPGRCGLLVCHCEAEVPVDRGLVGGVGAAQDPTRSPIHWLFPSARAGKHAPPERSPAACNPSASTHARPGRPRSCTWPPRSCPPYGATSWASTSSLPSPGAGSPATTGPATPPRITRVHCTRDKTRAPDPGSAQRSRQIRGRPPHSGPPQGATTTAREQPCCPPTSRAPAL